jgi:hypothetical protein
MPPGPGCSYAVKSGLTGVALLSPAELRSLPADVRTALHRLQWEIGRGQNYVWLARSIAADEPDCRSSRFSEADWAQITGRHGPSVRVLAGTFADRSGPNCFALALAAVTPSPAQALTIAGLWLHQAPFLRGPAELRVCRKRSWGVGRRIA